MIPQKHKTQMLLEDLEKGNNILVRKIERVCVFPIQNLFFLS